MWIPSTVPNGKDSRILSLLPVLSLVLFALFSGTWIMKETTTLRVMVLWSSVYATGQLVLSLVGRSHGYAGKP